MKFILVLFLAMTNVLVSAQNVKVSLNKLTEETQQMSESPNNLKLVWWIPTEYWKVLFSQQENMPQEQMDEILLALGKYTILATLDGAIGEFGDISYTSKDSIFTSLEIVTADKKHYTPLEESEIDPKTLEILGFMKPVIGNTLGRLGENMHFFVFNDPYDPLRRLVYPKDDQSFTVNLSNEEFTWKLPLPSLMPPRVCPTDGALLNGTWKYCPYHGTKLKEH